jgi:hypothetical protein
MVAYQQALFNTLSAVFGWFGNKLWLGDFFPGTPAMCFLQEAILAPLRSSLQSGLKECSHILKDSSMVLKIALFCSCCASRPKKNIMYIILLLIKVSQRPDRGVFFTLPPRP